MRILITEAQAAFLLEQSQIQILTETLNEDLRFKALLCKVKQALMGGMAAVAVIAAIDKLDIGQDVKDSLIEVVEEMEDKNNDAHDKKVQAIKDCFAYYCNLKGYDPEKIKLSPEKMIEVCDKYNFDLPLMLAQAKLESFFGFGNRCQKTNSVWSVGSYDNGKNAVTYSNVNDSIEPYVKIMTNEYLNDKTVDELLKDNCFKNYLGHRYASNPNYERTLRAIRNGIKSRFPDLG